MSTLAELVAAFDPDAAFAPPDTWLQGRTLYGGLTAALALRTAMLNHGPDLPAAKAAQVLFAAPVSGPMQFRSKVLRAGRAAVSVAVDALVGDDVVLRTAFVFAEPRPGDFTHDRIPKPDVPPPASLPELQPDARRPAFFNRFDVRFTGPAVPVSGQDTPEMLAWVRPRGDREELDPALALLALGDCLPPAVMASFRTFAPVSSLNWNVDFPTPARAQDWYLLRSTSLQADGGWSWQSMNAWREDGSLALNGTQTVAVFA